MACRRSRTPSRQPLLRAAWERGFGRPIAAPGRSRSNPTLVRQTNYRLHSKHQSEALHSATRVRDQQELVRRLYHGEPGPPVPAGLGNVENPGQAAVAHATSAGNGRGALYLRELDRARRAAPLFRQFAAADGNRVHAGGEWRRPRRRHGRSGGPGTAWAMQAASHRTPGRSGR